MKFTIIASVLALATLSVATPAPQNGNRPVANGACCIANTSQKEDVCTVNGQAGKCVPSGVNGCKSYQEMRTKTMELLLT
jgi:hypothetical protein